MLVKPYLAANCLYSRDEYGDFFQLIVPSSLKALNTWEPVVECSVAQDYWESQPHYSADYHLVNTEAISGSHEAMCMVMVS